MSEAKNYHLLPERQEELSNDKKQPRTQDAGVCLYVVGGEIHRDGVGVTTYNGRIFAAGGKYDLYVC